MEHKAVREGKDKHHKFRPSASTASIFEDIVTLGGKSNNMKHQIKSTIQLRDVNHRLDHLKSCVVQGSVFRLPSFKGEDIWSKVVSRFNDKVFSFVINSIQDILPHNVNLSRWRKSDTKKCPLCSSDQTLMHVLNNCSVSLKTNRITLKGILLLVGNYVLTCLDLDIPCHMKWETLRLDQIFLLGPQCRNKLSCLN